MKSRPQTSTTQRTTDWRSLEGIDAIAPVLAKTDNTRRLPSILDNVYWVELAPSANAEALCKRLSARPDVVYAVTLPEEKLFEVPNDPAAQPAAQQGYLDVINAYEAWDITQSSESIRIAIIDTGLDLGHEDLATKIHTNPVEVLNGLDDDNNGYIDDYRGYDFADNDPNAQADGSQHGTHVAGVAGAATNNAIGIASVGYHAQLGALKGFTTVGTSSVGVWEAVLYAAENGYDIMNLSWGSFNTYNPFLQDIITYAVVEKDVIVVAAAGNTNADLDFYPASYEHVLSVGASTLSDTKWSSATYSDHIDLMAPGQSIYSTQNSNTYTSENGSSFAAPQVAGAAALVKSVFDQYNARQIMEQLRVTSDDIYSVGSNSDYAYKLGKGRLNVHRAVTESNSRSMRLHNISYSNGLVPAAFHGDTVTLTFDLVNYLARVNSPTLSAVAASPFVTVLDAPLQPGSMQTMETQSAKQIRLKIADDTPPGTSLDVRFHMGEGSYSDFQTVSLRTEPNYYLFGSEVLEVNIGGDGDVCYFSPDYTEGEAMYFNGTPVLRFAGLMLGTANGEVRDNVIRSYAEPRLREDDFSANTAMRMLPHQTLPYVATSSFESNDGLFAVEQSVLPSQENRTTLVYRVVNTSGETMSDLYTGFFADYFLGNQTDNHVYWDETLEALIVYDDAENTFAALLPLESQTGYVALDMQAVNGNTRDVGDTFSDADKFSYLSGANIATAGTEGNGNDVAAMAKAHFTDMGPSEEAYFAVTLAVATSYTELAALLMNARADYASFREHPYVAETFFSCDYQNVLVDPSGSHHRFYQDALGTQFLSEGTSLLVDNIQADTAIYARRMDGAYPSAVQTLRIRVLEEVADFDMSTDTLYLDHPTTNTVQFTDRSFQGTGWQWDFGNGLYASVANPVVNFTEPGLYDITLTAQSALGCSDDLMRTLVVANRPIAPSFIPISVCPTENVILEATEGTYVWMNGEGQRIMQGSTLDLGAFTKDTTVYIRRKIDGYESLDAPLVIDVQDITAAFQVLPDTTTTDHRLVLLANDLSADTWQWTVNGQASGTGTSLSLMATAGALDIQLAVSKGDCEMQNQSVFMVGTSPLPEIENQTICLGESLTLEPQGGAFFGFYSDASLTQLIHKGKSWEIENMAQSQSLYVVGLDNGLPGEPAQVQIDVVDFTTDIEANPALLDLSQASKATFAPTATNVTAARWYVNDVLVEITLEPVLLFTGAGTYAVRLEAANADGCTSETELLYTVVNAITSVPTAIAHPYPNPVTPGGWVFAPDEARQLSLISLDGKKIASSGVTSLRVPADLTTGMYLLEIQYADRTETVRLLVKTR